MHDFRTAVLAPHLTRSLTACLLTNHLTNRKLTNTLTRVFVNKVGCGEVENEIQSPYLSSHIN